MPDILGIVLGQNVDKNGTSYLKMTGKEKQATLGILCVYTVIIVVDFFLCSKLTSRDFKGKPISKLNYKAGSKLSILGAFASCLHNLDRCQ